MTVFDVRALCATMILAPGLLSAQNSISSAVTLGGIQYYLNASSLVSASQDISDAQYATPISPAYNGVGAVRITKSAGTYICTGSLLPDGKSVLTAAHCLTGATGVQVRFYPVSATAVSINATSWVSQPLYTGQVIDENDIGVIRLNSEAPASITRYALATNSGENSPFRFVGFGRNGSNGAGTPVNNSGSSLSNRFAGENLFDITLGDARWEDYWNTQTSAAFDDILFADFDNGSTGYSSQDGMCWFGQYFDDLNTTECNAGRGIYEALTSSGDSGGPGFVDGKIASVTSFGLHYTFAGNSDIDGSLNSSFGEFAGFVDVADHYDWISDYIDGGSLDQTQDGPLTSTPEPGTTLLLGSGLLGLAIVVRRRNK